MRLGDVCTIYTGTGFPVQYQGNSQGKFPFYKVGDIAKNVTAGKVYLELCDNYVETDVVKKIKGLILPARTVVFAKIGEAVKLNRRAITSCECLIDNNVMGIAPNEAVLALDYFYHYMCQLRLETLAEATTVPSVKKSIVENLDIPVPSIAEQQMISKTLNKVSKLIAMRKEQLAKLDRLVKSRFIELFGDPVDNPKNYLVKSLQELIDMGYITYHLDGNHGGDYPRSEEFVDSGVPYIGANSIVNGEIDFSMAKYLTVERAGKLRKGISQNEDVLFAHNATVGPTVVLHTTEPKVILSTSLTAYRCNKSQLLPNYLRIYMLSDGFIRQYSAEMKQTTRNQVPITAQKKYLFLVPPIVEQEQFATFVEQTDKSKLAIQQSLDKLETLKKSLMQEYFG